LQAARPRDCCRATRRRHYKIGYDGGGAGKAN
jgi:hypothetical protein